MLSLVSAFFSVGLCLVVLYVLSTLAPRLLGREFFWFEGCPTITARITSAVISSAIAGLGCFLLVCVAVLPTQDTTMSITVMPGSPAAVAGVQSGDVIRGVNSRPLTSFEQLQQSVQLSEGTLTLELDRNGTRKSIRVVHNDQRLGVQSVMVDALLSPREATSRSAFLFTQTASMLIGSGAGGVRISGPVALVRQAGENRLHAHLFVLALTLVTGWFFVAAAHGWDLLTLACYLSFAKRKQASREVFNLSLLLFACGVLFAGSALGGAGRGTMEEPLASILLKSCSLAASLASFAALKGRMPLRRAGILAILGTLVGPVLWVSTLLLVYKKRGIPGLEQPGMSVD